MGAVAQTDLEIMARVTGLEPATSGVTGRRSNQLSYTPATPSSRRAFRYASTRGVSSRGPAVF